MNNEAEILVVLNGFKEGVISLGQLAALLGKSKYEALELLRKFNIPFADYDLAEDLQTIDNLFRLEH